MSLLEELGIQPEEFTWHDLAICDGMDPELFYSRYESDPETARQVDQACLSCPVIKQCALRGAQGEHGVWGATYWNGSGKPDANRNAHKTPEIWQEIKERLS